MREVLLIVLPLVGAILLLGLLTMKSKYDINGNSLTNFLISSGISGTGEIPVNPSDPSVPVNPNEPTVDPSDTDSTETCSCPTMSQCVVSGNPVLGGVDVIQYYTDFKMADGTYNESFVGDAGNSDYTSTYNGNTFYFKSQENKDMFDDSPSSFVPQYGGFCAWGIGGEYCPPYPWSKDCLGPSGNWGHWTIQNEKLYFFFFAEAKSKFMDDTSLYISQGDSRWDSWFETETYFSTDCYVSTVSDR